MVRLTTKGPPGAFAGAPYVEENAIDLEAIESEKVVFEGPVARAVKGFPTIVNVSAALSFAGIGLEKTQVRVIASPELREIVYEIEVEGSFGKMSARTVNVPSTTSPDINNLAVLSAVAMLHRILYALKVGT